MMCGIRVTVTYQANQDPAESERGCLKEFLKCILYENLTVV